MGCAGLLYGAGFLARGDTKYVRGGCIAQAGASAAHAIGEANAAIGAVRIGAFRKAAAAARECWECASAP